MKKKIYEMPLVTVTAIEAETFCAASIERTLDKTKEVGGSAMLSKENRGFDVWGDDSDE